MIAIVREWIYTLLICAVTGSIFSIAAPSPEMKKYVKLVCSLVAAALITAPIGQLITTVGVIDGDFTQQSAQMNIGDIQQSQSWILQQSRKQIEQGITSAITKKTGIIPAKVDIYIEQDEALPGELAVTGAEITLPAAAKGRADEIRYYIEYLVACPVEMKYT